MCELQVCPPSKRRPVETVCRLEFSADGSELVAWVGVVLHAYDLRTDTARVLVSEFESSGWEDFIEGAEIVLSPDHRMIATAFNPDGDNCHIDFVDLTDREYYPPSLPTDSIGRTGLMFTADGKALIAVRNSWNDGYEPDVARFEMAALTAPPKRYVEKLNPLTGKTYQAPVRDLKWKRVLTFPRGAEACAAALSADDRLVAAGTEDGTVHVADIKKKTLASFGWEGKKLRDNEVTRVGFDPAGAWVASIAGGRLLCARSVRGSRGGRRTCSVA